jgi:pantoate--beta-alanine ligase
VNAVASPLVKTPMETSATIAGVRTRIAAWHAQGLRVAFVPTMGNLHAGHLSLIRAARRYGERFVASIFVNPMQFGPNEDFNHYPRTPDSDAKMLEEAGCNLMFMPNVSEIYPNGADKATRVDVPELSATLDGAFRPGHFEGVATIVAKLFNIVDPDVAIFGEKDFQQLTIIRRMATDLCMRVQIIGAPTVREASGLAMSSRNQYLTDQEREVAPVIHKSLSNAVERLKQAGSHLTPQRIVAIESEGTDALRNAGLKPDYFSVRDSDSLGVPSASSRLVVLTAARLGKARLIDNLRV